MGYDENEFMNVVEQIRKVSASIGQTKVRFFSNIFALILNANIFYQVDVYDQLVSTVPEPSRLKISRRVLRKLLQIRDKQRLKFR